MYWPSEKVTVPSTGLTRRDACDSHTSKKLDLIRISWSSWLSSRKPAGKGRTLVADSRCHVEDIAFLKRVCENRIVYWFQMCA